MLVLQAKTISDALDTWNDIVLIFGSKQESKEVKSAIDSLKKKSKAISDETDANESVQFDFDDESSKEEEVSFGNRRLLRENPPFYTLFKRPFDKLQEAEKDHDEVSNLFHALHLVALMAKQYLSLFHLLSAIVLEDGLVKNTHVELYWKEQRRLIKGIPDRIIWPSYYLGNLHTSLRREAKNFLLHSRIPSLKYGGKSKSGPDIRFSEYFNDSPTKPANELFVPTPGKGERRKRKVDETFSGCQEEWNSRKKRTHKKKRYMKGKIWIFLQLEVLLMNNSGKGYLA